jgi:hypothetical protein
VLKITSRSTPRSPKYRKQRIRTFEHTAELKRFKKSYPAGIVPGNIRRNAADASTTSIEAANACRPSTVDRRALTRPLEFNYAAALISTGASIEATEGGLTGRASILLAVAGNERPLSALLAACPGLLAFLVRFNCLGCFGAPSAPEDSSSFLPPLTATTTLARVPTIFAGLPVSGRTLRAASNGLPRSPPSGVPGILDHAGAGCASGWAVVRDPPFEQIDV